MWLWRDLMGAFPYLQGDPQSSLLSWWKNKTVVKSWSRRFQLHVRRKIFIVRTSRSGTSCPGRLAISVLGGFPHLSGGKALSNLVWIQHWSCFQQELELQIPSLSDSLILSHRMFFKALRCLCVWMTLLQLRDKRMIWWSVGVLGYNS